MKTYFKLTIFVALIAIFSSNSVFAQRFPDVGANETYKKGIEYLASLNIIHGHQDGTFKPLDSLTRAEMMKIIVEGSFIYYDMDQNILDNYRNKNCFPDVSPNQWFTKYICYGKEKNWVIGYGDGSFRPEQNVSFVEGLKITFKGFNLAFIEPNDEWFRDLVIRAGNRNFIPHTINGFHNHLKRNQMSDMVARILKFEEGAEQFEEYLGDRAEIKVTYDVINKKLDIDSLKKEIIRP